MNISISPRQFGTEDAIAFLEGSGWDGAGRTIEDYFKFDSDKWEECHNHVQWAFPSNIPSDFNGEAPVVDMHQFRENITADALVNMLGLVGDYLTSLGFKQDDNGEYRFDASSPRTAIWITPGNHNYRRISRLLNVLSNVAPDLAIHLLREFVKAYEYGYNKWETHYMHDSKAVSTPCMNHATLLFWTKAATGTL